MGLFRKGPEERAAQHRLDEAQESGRRHTRAQAEKLSDDVYEARGRDRASRRGGKR